MPALRVSTRGRRRSSVAAGLIPLAPAKPGNYGINVPSPRNVSFAPNITPSTYVESEDAAHDDDDEPASPADALFPPAEIPAPAPSRRRAPPGKRRSQGYIPRPPNAFMLFRADFVRQKHVPGSIETNHGSLSKIIGNCWRQLPLEEKRVWESRAKRAKAEHKEKYPNYKFRPVHKKHKKRDASQKDKPLMSFEDERRCEEVAHFLLEGKKGDELAAAVRMLDMDRSREMTMSASASPMLHMPIPLPMGTYPSSMPLYAQRRSSSVPPMMFYNPINVPNVPFLVPQQPSFSRPESPVSAIARSNRFILGQRRASSVGASLERNWMMPPQSMFYPHELQTDHEPLPDVDTSLFDPSFLESSSFGFSMSQHNNPHLQTEQFSISPLDPMSSVPSSASSQHPAYPFYSQETAPDQPQPYANEQINWAPALDASSGPSTVFSGSPSPSEQTLPQPHLTSSLPTPQPEQPQPQQYVQGWQAAPLPEAVPPLESEFSFEQLQGYAEMESYSQVPVMYGAEAQHCGMEAGMQEVYAYPEYSVEVPQY